MTDPALMTPRNLLTQAIDQAHAVVEEGWRASLLEALALAAIDHGEAALAQDVVGELEDAGARGALHMALAEALASAGQLDSARAHLDAAAASARSVGRWSPRPDWLGPSAAMARVVAAHASLGTDPDLLRAEQIARTIDREGSSLARSWSAVAAAWRLREGEEAEAHEVETWDLARSLVREVSDPQDRRDLTVELAQAVITRGDAAAASQLAREAISEAGGFDWLQRVVLLEEIGRALARGGFLEAAAWSWTQAVDLAVEGRQDYRRAVDALCRLADAQAGPLGPGVAGETLDIALQIVAAVPLDPEARAPSPWAAVRELVERWPELVPQLVAVLEQRSELPPAWRFVAARLALSCQRSPVARTQVAALQLWKEPEARAYEAILRVGLGELVSGRRLMVELLDQDRGGGSVLMPVGRTHEEPLPGAFVDALLGAGSVSAALELARTVAESGVRAELLVEVAEAARANGDLRQARGIVSEARRALDEAGAAEGRAVELGLRLAVLYGVLDDEAGLGEAVQIVVEAARAAPGGGAVGLLAMATGRLRQARLGSHIGPLRTAAFEALLAAPGPGERCEAVLAWLGGLPAPTA